MKYIFIAFAILLGFSVQSQNECDNFDIRFGAGPSLLGSGDMITTMVETELNYKLSQYFTTGTSIAYGKSSNGVFMTAAFLQGNINLFFSPFKNNNRNDFRIGTGLTACNITDAYLISAEYMNDIVVDEDYLFETRNAVGANVIVENSYAITDRLLTGIKLFTQIYHNGDMNSGILLKLGVKL